MPEKTHCPQPPHLLFSPTLHSTPDFTSLLAFGDPVPFLVVLAGKLPSLWVSFSPSFVSLDRSSDAMIYPFFSLSAISRASRISFLGSSCFICACMMVRKVEKSSSPCLSGNPTQQVSGRNQLPAHLHCHLEAMRAGSPQKWVEEGSVHSINIRLTSSTPPHIPQ